MEQTIVNNIPLCIVNDFNFDHHIIMFFYVLCIFLAALVLINIILICFNFQGQDDFTVITMLRPQQEIQAQFTVAISDTPDNS